MIDLNLKVKIFKEIFVDIEQGKYKEVAGGEL